LTFEAEEPVQAENDVRPEDFSADAEGAPWNEEFAFTIAIGRRANSAPGKISREEGAERMDIDVSAPPEQPVAPPETGPASRGRHAAALFLPVAPLAKRGMAALLDLLCLLFSYGGFLMLFTSLGGRFSFSKLNAMVYTATLALFYIQYFALFTVFGGTTPGMMLCRLQVASYDGEQPTPQQLLMRSLGYLLSAGTFFLGFLGACWDEDQLTWHDRLSRTYLVSDEGPREAASASTVRGR
jgi:uncharacterized RDD family membrane protein YckC